MTNKPVARLYTPQQIADAQAKADAHRAEIHEQGRHEGLRHAGWYRDAALAGGGFIVGALVAFLFATSMYERGVMTAGAVADRILTRTIAEPAAPVEPARQYEARGAELPGCRPGQVMPGGRRCPPEPASAP